LAVSRRFDEAVHVANAGLAVNPNNDASLYDARAVAEISPGRFDEAKSDVQQAIRMRPRDPFKGVFYKHLGDIEIGEGRPEAAIDAGERMYRTYADLAASYALLGKMDEAKRPNDDWPLKIKNNWIPDAKSFADGFETAR
jgi:tetratricopeptide (TPR) repeat protein